VVRLARSDRRVFLSGRVAAVAAVGIVALLASACSSSGSGGGANKTTASSGGSSVGSSAAGASITPYDQQAPITPLTSITVGYSAQSADDLELFAAVNNGYFTKEGLKVTTKLLQSAPGISALIAGQTQFSVIGAADTMSAVAGGASNLRWIGTADTYAAELFYSRPNITSADQLKGATIASTSTAGTNTVCTKLAMEHFGITDYKITYLGSVTSDVAALQSGAAQAICINPPASLALDSAGYHDLWSLTDAKIRIAQNGIATTQDEITNHPEIVQQFMTAMTEGMKAIHDTSPAAITADATLLGQITGGTVTEAQAGPTVQFEQKVQSGNLTPVLADLSTPQKYEAQITAAVGNIDLNTFTNATFAQTAATAVYGANPPTA
jgi:ABC-type nitrate/sulfonate/bicarbonate transport system substrate-binding protein